MDKRYQVFISSTYEDLQDERKEVMQALLELDCIPAGMELFPASSDDQWTLIKRVIDDCDYYLLVIGGKYGSTNEDGISYTQMEFEYALKSGKPIISFLHKSPDKIPSGKSEQDPGKKEKLQQFRKLAQKKLVKFWDSPDNLGSVVSRSMVKLIKEFPAEGWVKCGSNIDVEFSKEITYLQRENRRLKEKLEQASSQAPDGSERLSQGDDLVDIEFSFTTTNNYRKQYTKMHLSWNEIFKLLSPRMINGCSEDELQDTLSSYFEAETEKKLSNTLEIDELTVLEKSFLTIIIQLRALGLIQVGEKLINNKATEWKLTKYGDRMMTQLLAIQKQSE